VPYDRYRYPNGLTELREQIEAENPGVVVPPLSMKWMRAVSTIECHFQTGRLPKNAASVIFKMPGKVVAQKLLVEMWVAGNRFRALPYIPNKADTLCGMCGWWGHSEFRCQRGAATCTICAESHRTKDVTARRRRHDLFRTTRVWNVLDVAAQGRFGFWIARREKVLGFGVLDA